MVDRLMIRVCIWMRAERSRRVIRLSIPLANATHPPEWLGILGAQIPWTHACFRRLTSEMSYSDYVPHLQLTLSIPSANAIHPPGISGAQTLWTHQNYNVFQASTPDPYPYFQVSDYLHTHTTVNLLISNGLECMRKFTIVCVWRVGTWNLSRD
jgi:hypothetical protein